MEAASERGRDAGIVEVARLLVFVQAAIAVTTTIEAAVVGTAFGAPFGAPFLLTAISAVTAFFVARGLRRRSRRARKIAIWIEGLILAGAIVDLLLALFLARRGLELVPVVTQIVIPIAVIRLLRRPQARSEFGAKPSRRARKLEAKAAA